MNDLSPYSDFARVGAQAEILAAEAASPEVAQTLRHSVLGPSRKAEFLQNLQMFGNVRLACRAARVSAQTAYRARRRSDAFAQAWDASLLAARSHAEATLADRAINGVDEPVFYHGEEIARRRRYDPRLLLAHLARLDRLEEREEVAAMLSQLDDCIDALRAGQDFDEMALAAGQGGCFEGEAREADAPSNAGAKEYPQDSVPSVPSCRVSDASPAAEGEPISLEARLRAMEAARPRSAPSIAAQAASEAEIGLIEAHQLTAFEAGEDDWWEALPEPGVDTASDTAPDASGDEADLAQGEEQGTIATPLGKRRGTVTTTSHTGLAWGCAAALLAGAIGSTATPALAQDDYKSLGATLFGENEVGHEGAGEDAGGDFDGEIDMSAGTLCYYLEVYGLDDITAVHLHKGGKDENGPPVLTLEVMGEDGDEVCAVAEADLLKDIMADEEAYYINVHTTALPAGAIRGQLGS